MRNDVPPPSGGFLPVVPSRLVDDPRLQRPRPDGSPPPPAPRRRGRLVLALVVVVVGVTAGGAWTWLSSRGAAPATAGAPGGRVQATSNGAVAEPLPRPPLGVMAATTRTVRQLGARLGLVAAPAERAAAPAAATPPAPSDSSVAAARAQLPLPPLLAGAWTYADNRSRYSDSLTLVLHRDGAASGLERRYSLSVGNGWLEERTARQGTWQIRYQTTRADELCIRWRVPIDTTTCEPVIVDSLIGGRMLSYAGRYWRTQPSTKASDVGRTGTKRRAAQRRR